MFLITTYLILVLLSLIFITSCWLEELWILDENRFLFPLTFFCFLGDILKLYWLECVRVSLPVARANTNDFNLWLNSRCPFYCLVGNALEKSIHFRYEFKLKSNVNWRLVKVVRRKNDWKRLQFEFLCYVLTTNKNSS